MKKLSVSLNEKKFPVREKMKKKISRRDFMQKGTYAVLGSAAALSTLKTSQKTSRVILIRHRSVLDENLQFNEVIIREMLETALMKLFNQTDPLAILKKLIKPHDIVGIKSNEWNYLPTPVELENVIKKMVMDAGVKGENIGIDDRGVKENPIFQKATALINVRPLRTHSMAGVSGCMKNYITFSEHYPAYHPNNCEKLAKLFQLPLVKGKTRFHVLSVLTPQFHGRGPHHFSRRYVWPYKGLLVGTDPVAVDAIGLKIILAKRAQFFGKNSALPFSPTHIKAADIKYKLGTSDPEKIDLIKLGWKEGILI
jgi:hypothetical protein